jgi:hypothetical protein
VKDRIFHSSGDGTASRGHKSWFAVKTDDPRELAVHLKALQPAEIKRHFKNGDLEKWLIDLYHRPDLAEAIRRLRATWNGVQNPRAELVAVLESRLHRAG